MTAKTTCSSLSVVTFDFNPAKEWKPIQVQKQKWPPRLARPIQKQKVIVKFYLCTCIIMTRYRVLNLNI